MPRASVVLFLAAAVLCAPDLVRAAPASETGRLRGEARTPDRRPVSGATVLAVRNDAADDAVRPVVALTSTDPGGFIAIDGLPAGEYRVVVTSQGLGPGRLDAVRVGGPFRSVVDLVMTPGDSRPGLLTIGEGEGPSSARVRVTDASGAPLAGALLLLEPLGHRHDPVERLTDEDGAVLIDGLGAGRWRLVLRKTGWTRLRVPVVEWQAGDATILVRMLPQTGKEKVAAADLLPAPSFRPPSAALPEPVVSDPDPDGTTDTDDGENAGEAEGASGPEEADDAPAEG